MILVFCILLQIFKKVLRPEDLTSAAALIVDQFNENPSLQNKTKQFIYNFRLLNQQAWILETSWVARGQVYPETNAFLTGEQVMNAQEIVGKPGLVPGVRLETLRMMSNPAFIEAQLADPTKKLGYDRLSNERERVESYSRLVQRSEAHQLQQLIENVPGWLKLQQLDVEKQRLFLHYAWDIIGHLYGGSEESFYGLTLNKLKELIKLIT